MAFDQKLAERVRRILAFRPDVEEKKMFGGLAFMVAGHMCCGALQDGLIVRPGKEAAAANVNRPGVKYLDFTGKRMTSMLQLAPEAVRSDRDLKNWIELALAFVDTLPSRL